MSGDTPLTIDELIEYCRVQAGLLSGRAATIGEEADELLDEIDADIEAIRADIDDTETADVDDIEERQAIVEAKQARMSAFQDLSAEYTALAEALAGVDDWQAALERVVEFEQDHDAPAYFEERQTLLEAVAESNESPE